MTCVTTKIRGHPVGAHLGRRSELVEKTKTQLSFPSLPLLRSRSRALIALVSTLIRYSEPATGRVGRAPHIIDPTMESKAMTPQFYVPSVE